MMRERDSLLRCVVSSCFVRFCISVSGSFRYMEKEWKKRGKKILLLIFFRFISWFFLSTRHDVNFHLMKIAESNLMLAQKYSSDKSRKCLALVVWKFTSSKRRYLFIWYRCDVIEKKRQQQQQELSGKKLIYERYGVCVYFSRHPISTAHIDGKIHWCMVKSAKIVHTTSRTNVLQLIASRW